MNVAIRAGGPEKPEREETIEPLFIPLTRPVERPDQEPAKPVEVPDRELVPA